MKMSNRYTSVLYYIRSLVNYNKIGYQFAFPILRVIKYILLYHKNDEQETFVSR